MKTEWSKREWESASVITIWTVISIYSKLISDDTNILYHNDGKGNFDDVTRASRIGVETRYMCWGAGIVDLDNDGYPDISWSPETFTRKWNANFRNTPTNHRAQCFGISAAARSKNSSRGWSRRERRPLQPRMRIR